MKFILFIWLIFTTKLALGQNLEVTTIVIDSTQNINFDESIIVNIKNQKKIKFSRSIKISASELYKDYDMFIYHTPAYFGLEATTKAMSYLSYTPIFIPQVDTIECNSIIRHIPVSIIVREFYQKDKKIADSLCQYYSEVDLNRFIYACSPIKYYWMNKGNKLILVTSLVYEINSPEMREIKKVINRTWKKMKK